MHACLWDTTPSEAGIRWWIQCTHPTCEYGQRGVWTSTTEPGAFALVCTLANGHEAQHNRPGGAS
jgi:hypothetical protein